MPFVDPRKENLKEIHLLLFIRYSVGQRNWASSLSCRDDFFITSSMGRQRLIMLLFNFSFMNQASVYAVDFTIGKVILTNIHRIPQWCGHAL